ncbi:MAG: inorganic polyphosphate/ATP-NAD kinase [Spirochaeta sp.]|jgi:NAD+ kinase|uniref:NAD(+)/NADH kinase n=1 Tax=unclassified Sphaerochaeta TaxID=2637943 RepID=UPI0018E9E58B|nr:NAD(+)/NADH kinase [Sphaerochaeta sp. S2]MBZ4673731.1 inorganic polyphosphate/ATP-NAD kinase [Spirochaeta sp.]MCK9347750.1 NAD(+)/NADH kinase [Sphaerochaeta sp.]MBJ2356164.1 NAD(+)/NADH kinase [Sphaerochaeta sp. S2]MDD4301519.1 NAD(+)/NADH kinase [Sphaerochaeta sp.]MDD4646837.1 NAD(+)/NADH kinase [Sphaerochaeta sp.]
MEQRQVRHVLIIANWSKKTSHTLSQTIVDYLAEKGIESSVSRTNKGNEPLVVNKDTDLVICLGGDGTVLYCARYLQDLGIPILAINVGTFGYITEISVEEWQEAIDYFLEGKNTISRRLMIRVGVFRKGKKVFTAHGLNEMVVSSSGISKVVSLSLRIGSTEAGFFRSDGMIIATPTGSTGYSLAAGGPILDVDLTSLIITPICPFTLSNRPLVVSGDSTITLTIPKGQRTGLMLSVDGQQNFCLQEDDMIVVEKSQSKALLVASERRNYIEVLRDKLNWSGGGLHA